MGVFVMQAKNLSTFRESLRKAAKLESRSLVGVCLIRMYIVTNMVPSKQQTAQESAAKRHHDGAETGPRKVKKTQGKEQDAPRKERYPANGSINT